VHIDFEERFWYKVFNLIKEQCYYSMNSEEKIQYSCILRFPRMVRSALK